MRIKRTFDVYRSGSYWSATHESDTAHRGQFVERVSVYASTRAVAKEKAIRVAKRELKGNP